MKNKIILYCSFEKFYFTIVKDEPFHINRIYKEIAIDFIPNQFFNQNMLIRIV